MSTFTADESTHREGNEPTMTALWHSCQGKQKSQWAELTCCSSGRRPHIAQQKTAPPWRCWQRHCGSRGGTGSAFLGGRCDVLSPWAPQVKWPFNKLLCKGAEAAGERNSGNTQPQWHTLPTTVQQKRALRLLLIGSQLPVAMVPTEEQQVKKNRGGFSALLQCVCENNLKMMCCCHGYTCLTTWCCRHHHWNVLSMSRHSTKLLTQLRPLRHAMMSDVVIDLFPQ